jgi:hypothetical protein
MKKVLSFFLLSFLSLTLALGQNNTLGGTNFYVSSGFLGQTLPALSASGDNALVYTDYTHGDDQVVTVLRNRGFAVTVAASASSFNTKLAAGGWDLVVLFNQNYYISSSGLDFTTVQNYVTAGGAMIFTSWDDAGSGAWANLFEASYTGNNNNLTVTITDPAIAYGVTNPLHLTNYWGIACSNGLSAIGSGQVLATFSNGEAAMIRGNGGRTIILGYLSDAPAPSVQGTLFSNVCFATGVDTVPVPYWSIIVLFVLIALGIVFTKRKAIFSHN